MKHYGNEPDALIAGVAPGNIIDSSVYVSEIDAGEADCINIAMQYAYQVFLVMDDRAGRSAIKG